jgi:Mg2+-importing ATPase
MRVSSTPDDEHKRAAPLTPTVERAQPLSLSALLAQLQASARGLSSQEARQRLAQFGSNELVTTRRASVAVQLARHIASPLVLILLLAALVSAFLGELVNAAIIALIVSFSIALDFVQTYRSQQAAERLRAQVALTASALRDGAWVEVPRTALVPGDVIQLTAGDLVPADARLITARDLHINQAALTGESLPVEKVPLPTDATSPAPSDDRANVFLGSSVVSGTATAVVVATGRATMFGDIAARLAMRPPETAFDRGVRQFGLFILQTVFFLVVFVFLVNAALHRDPFESLLFAVALAVGLTPEFLPMITTVTLAQGAVQMAKQHVIVKHLAAIQNFGSMDILCSDKTGTLTSGALALESHVDPLGQPSERVFLLAYLNSRHETGVPDPANAAILHRMAANPLDVAILRHDHPDVHAYEKLDEIPFDFERRRASVVVATAGSADGATLITKGAPESVIAICSAYEVAGKRQPLDATAHERCIATEQQLSAQGYRVLAVASRVLPRRDAYHVAEEADLVLAGFLTFVDPPLPDAADALRALREDGVTVKILTGDNDLVARHICGQVGLGAQQVVLGDDLDRISDAALAHIAEQAPVFARVSPAQKHRVLLALKSRGHVVGFLGDGINDAPSLHTADVGISVMTGVDVARDAAEIILLEPGLRVLHTGILAGRRAFGNVMKYLLMGTSSNFGNMFSMAGAALLLPFLPMLPTQILLNNFLYDLAQVTIPTDHVDPSFTHKPRRWDISAIRQFMLFIGPISSLYDFLTFWALLTLFHASEALFHTGWFVESLATQTLVLFVIRTAGNPLRSRPSWALTITTLLVVLIGIALPLTPLAAALGFTPLPITFYLFLLGATSTYLLLVEIVKRQLMGRLFR